MTEPKKPKPDAGLNRIDQALADIERHRQEIQTASSAGVANLLAETEQCRRLTALEIDMSLQKRSAVAEKCARHGKALPWDLRLEWCALPLQ
jgi:hypothetical protein